MIRTDDTAGLTDSERRTVTENLGLVHHIVARVMHRFPSGFGRDDLVQVGTLGLIDAVRRYDPERGTRFSSYAGRRIEGAITDHLRSTDWAPRSVRSYQRMMALAEANGAVTDDDISRVSGLDLERVRRTRADVDRSRLESVEHHFHGGTDIADAGHSVDADLLRREELDEMRTALGSLPIRQRLLVEAHFLDGRTLTEIGEALGITQSRASQLKAEALATLNRVMTSYGR